MSKDIEAGSNGDVEVGEAAAATVGTPSSSNFRQRKAMLLSFLFILAIVAVAIAGARSRVGYVAIGAMMVYGIHWTLIWLYESLVDPFLPSHGLRHKVKRTSARLAYYAVFFLSFATMFRHRDGDDVNAYGWFQALCDHLVVRRDVCCLSVHDVAGVAGGNQ